MPFGNRFTSALRKRIARNREHIFLFANPELGSDTGLMPEIRDLLRHPARNLVDSWCAPRTRASLFNYIDAGKSRQAIDWKGLGSDLVTGYRRAFWLPSLWSETAQLVAQRSELRTRRMEAASASVVVHAIVLAIAVLVTLSKPVEVRPGQNEAAVFVNAPMNLPFLPEGRSGGGGGGGGKNETLAPSFGRLPDAAPLQLMPPDPGVPKPLLPSDNPEDLKPTIQMPVNLPQDPSLPIGDILAPPGGQLSSGPGKLGGIGTGTGPGIGAGRGAGAGSGDDGGYGKGKGGGVGDDVGPYYGGRDLTLPEALYKPSPVYTEEARKSRTEGIVVLQVTITANGNVTAIKVLQGLGHGLDESAIRTIATQWKFRPAMYGGAAIDFIARIEVTFHLY